jgi:GntR family transcriptional regulator/MocR family aminotransferase
MSEHDLSLWVIPITGKKPSSSFIEEFIVGVIKSRAVLPGENIPSHRIVARLNHVNRNTALRAYTKLIAMGWLTHRRGSKAVVANPLPNDVKLIINSNMPNSLPLPLPFPTPENSDLLKVSQPEFIQVGISTIEKSSDYLRKALLKNSSKFSDKQDGYIAGNFHQNILMHLKLRRFSINLEHLLVVRGRGDSLKCIFKVLNTAENVILNTAPSDKVVSSIIRQFSRYSIGLDMGMPHFLQKIEETLQKTKINALYIRPNACYPTCKNLDDATCVKLIALAKKHQFYIIEEDDDHEFWWGKHPSKPLVHHEHEGFVVHCSALSRASAYMQNIRTVIAPAQLISALKSLPDIGYGYQDQMEEKSINKLLTNHGLISISRQARLSKQRDLKNLHAILQLQIGQFISYELPESGTALWINFPKKLDLKRNFELLKIEGFRLKICFNLKKPNSMIQSMRLDITNFDELECRRIAIRLRTLMTTHKINSK